MTPKISEHPPTCFGASQAKGSSASSVTIQGDIVVPEELIN